MLLTIRIITIIVSIACMVAGGFLIVAGLLDTPEKDIDAVWIGAGIMVFYLADLYLLYRSYKKKHAPTHWVALILSILPAAIILVILWLLDKAGY